MPECQVHTGEEDHTRVWMDSFNMWTGLPVKESIRMTEDRDKMEKVHLYCGQPSDLGRLKNKTVGLNAFSRQQP